MPIQYHYLLVGLHIFVVGCATCLVPVDYMYRYMLICRFVFSLLIRLNKVDLFRKKEPSTSQLIIIIFTGCFVCFITALLFIWAFGREKPSEIERYGHLLREEQIWFDEDGSLVQFIGTDCVSLFI